MLKSLKKFLRNTVIVLIVSFIIMTMFCYFIEKKRIRMWEEYEKPEALVAYETLWEVYKPELNWQPSVRRDGETVWPTTFLDTVHPSVEQIQIIEKFFAKDISEIQRNMVRFNTFFQKFDKLQEHDSDIFWDNYYYEFTSVPTLVE